MRITKYTDEIKHQKYNTRSEINTTKNKVMQPMIKKQVAGKEKATSARPNLSGTRSEIGGKGTQKDWR